ncbi:MAG: DNA internalization-related competence protein ComEC/Rec2 [Burkholderiales bacterium]
MRANIVLFAVGVWLLQREPVLPDMRYAYALALVVPCIVLFKSRRRLTRAAARALVGAFAVTAGFFWAAALAHVRMGDALPPAWEGRDIELTGVVASLPQPYERSVRFDFDVEQVMTPGAVVPARIALSWWGREDELPQVHAAERWRFTVRLKRPHGTVNPHGFDYEAWLLERGVRATGYVRTRAAAQRLSGLVKTPAYAIEAVREGLRVRILDALSGSAYGGVIAALVIGDQRAITPAQWQTFTRTGVNHLMSISGLHVTMVSGLVYMLALALWRRSATLTLHVPAAKAAAGAGVLGALMYTLLAGFAVPAQRTLYMICVVALALWTGAATSASLVLTAALLVVLLLDPWAVLSPGFWLSFGAVGAILFVLSNRVAEPGWLDGWARTQAAVTVAMLPLSIGLFQQVSLVSPLANAFAIPVISLVVVPLALLGAVAPFDALLVLAHAVLAASMQVLEWMSALPEVVWQQHAPPAWTVVAAAGGVLWLMLPRGVPARWLGAVACLPMFLALPPRLEPGELRVAVLDVGQGLAVVLQTREHALLYDSGPAFGPSADSGNRIIVPYLRAAGVRRLDGFIVSHDDADHSGGALSVLQALPVDWLLSSLPDMDPLPFVADHAVRCHGGQHWEWDGVRFDILHPAPASYDERMKSNERGCVLKVTAPGGTILVPGDIEGGSEERLLAQDLDLRADILVAPHHGSRTSSVAPFVESVRPRAVIFTTGYRNRFGHPHADVVERWSSTGAALHRTDRDGAVLVAMPTPGRMRVERYRALHRRYWLEAPVEGSTPAGAEGPFN